MHLKRNYYCLRRDVCAGRFHSFYIALHFLYIMCIVQVGAHVILWFFSISTHQKDSLRGKISRITRVVEAEKEGWQPGLCTLWSVFEYKKSIKE